MKSVEHVLAVCFEGCCEEVVQVGLVSEINSGDGNRAPVARLAGACCRARCLVGALGVHGAGDLAHDVGLRVTLPVLKSRMVSHERTHPLVRVLHYLLVYAIFVVLLHVCIEEQVKTGDVAK